MPPEMLENLSPKMIVPLVAYLCHADTEENGSLFEAGAGWFGKLRWERTKGAVFKTDASFTPAAVSPLYTMMRTYLIATNLGCRSLGRSQRLLRQPRAPREHHRRQLPCKMLDLELLNWPDASCRNTSSDPRPSLPTPRATRFDSMDRLYSSLVVEPDSDELVRRLIAV